MEGEKRATERGVIVWLVGAQPQRARSRAQRWTRRAARSRAHAVQRARGDRTLPDAAVTAKAWQPPAASLIGGSGPTRPRARVDKIEAVRYKCRLPRPRSQVTAGLVLSRFLSSGASAHEPCGSSSCPLRSRRGRSPSPAARLARPCSPAAARTTKTAADKPPVEVTVVTATPEDVPVTPDLRRADAELAGGEHPGARLGLPRQARLHRRRGGQGGPGAVPDGPEAVPGAGRRRERRAAAQPGGAAGRASQPRRTKPLAEQNALSQKDLDDATGPVRAGRGRRRAGEGATRGSEAQPVLHDDHLAGRRRFELRGGRRRHVSEPAERAAHHGFGADTDVGELQLSENAWSGSATT